MASGSGTSDGLGREEHTSLGKATHENKTSAALESLSGPEKNQNPEILSTQDVAQDLTLSKGKQALQDSKYGHDSIDQSKQSSTSWPIGSFRDGPGIFPSSKEGPSSSSKKRLIQALQETDAQTYGPDPAQSNLDGVAASVAPAGATPVEPNGGSLVVLNDVGRAEPFVAPIVVLHGVAPVQSNVALIVAPPSEVLAQPNIAPDVTPPVVASNVAPPRVAPVAPDVTPHAQRNGALPAPAQPNAALIVAPRGAALAQPVAAAIVAPRVGALAQPNAALIVAPLGVALAQPNAAVIVAPPGVALAQPNAAPIVVPPAVVVLDVNCGLKLSRLKPLRICEIGSEGHFWLTFP